MEPNVKEKEEEIPKVESIVKEKVAVDKEGLKTILERLEALEVDNKTLRASVSQAKLTEVENAKRPSALPTAYLKVYKGKIVTSWKSEKMEYVYNPSNPEAPVGEIVKATYFFIDGTDSGVVDQVMFTRATDRIEAEILDGLKGIKDPELKEFTLKFTNLITTDEDLRQSFVVPTEPLKINRNFINPV